MGMKKRFLRVLAVLIGCLVLVIGSVVFIRVFIPPKNLAQLAYDHNPWGEYTVYLQEGDQYVPYLVLTNRYNGEKSNVLLLRKYVLREPMRVCWYEFLGSNPRNLIATSYYEDSMIDTWLNSEFIALFPHEVQNAMVFASVEITAKRVIGRVGYETLEIPRRVFLISCTELGRGGLSIMNEEGIPLKYFSKVDNRTAYWEKTGEAISWWTRTADLASHASTFFFGAEYGGPLGSDASYYRSGVRPAICIEGNTEITRAENIVKGQEVYILAMNPA